MAARASTYWRTMLKRMEGNRMFATTSTLPKMKPVAATVEAPLHHQPPPTHKKGGLGTKLKGDYVPIYVTMGLVLLAMTFGVHTAKQQLNYAPAIQINKKRRGAVPEVEEPDLAIHNSDKFINKSFLRKVGHIQDPNQATIPNPIRGDIYSSPRKAETLASVGVGSGRY